MQPRGVRDIVQNMSGIRPGWAQAGTDNPEEYPIPWKARDGKLSVPDGGATYLKERELVGVCLGRS
jgi:hypothetical protein